MIETCQDNKVYCLLVRLGGIGPLVQYWTMPKKIRELKAMLLKAGFYSQPGKGSHTVWWHPALSTKLTLSGGNGDDAEPYQERQVQKILRQVQDVLKKRKEAQE